ncbi:hypothetical protein FH972_017180 [Carpinus fangiana]|uniref:BAG domain-containing protein n=1 Tax=Carpinus fangiana TaxID=176857 RepID=A0A5N6RLH6_9ROSI|nr:hypothetical protein FH972_017180 [Carpinus fangiana]
MKQLLKLDSIEAEGEAKLQRKAEVRRVQNFVEKLDNLKGRNGNPNSNSKSSECCLGNNQRGDLRLWSGKLECPTLVIFGKYNAGLGTV